MFAHPLKMNAQCSHCGHVFDRGNGYFIGAMYSSYLISTGSGILLLAALVLTGHLSLHFPFTERDWLALVAVAVFVLVLGPLITFPYSRVFWVWAERNGLWHHGDAGRPDRLPLSPAPTDDSSK